MSTRSVSTAILVFACLAGMSARAGAQGAQPAPRPAQPAAAQAPATLTFPTFELSGGYQFLKVPDDEFPFGLNVDGAWNFNEAFGVVGEIGWAFMSDDSDDVDVDSHAWTFGVGPRWNHRGGERVWPFAQILAGAIHARSSFDDGTGEVNVNDTKFMLQPGVGVNIIGGDGWGVVGQVDYRRVFLDEDEDGDSGENEYRVFVGIRLMLD
jgi:hypothetical protein